MDLTQLANLGEFIGGVAVLVTLIYLATQVRQVRGLAQLAVRGRSGVGAGDPAAARAFLIRCRSGVLVPRSRRRRSPGRSSGGARG
jgi:hypothetical protein